MQRKAVPESGDAGDHTGKAGMRETTPEKRGCGRLCERLDEARGKRLRKGRRAAPSRESRPPHRVQVS